MSASFPTSALVDERDARDLLALLETLPDPRPTGGRLHPLGYVLAVTLVAFTCPAFAHLVGAAAWAGGVSDRVLRLLGARPDPLSGAVRPPSEATIRRVINGVDPQALGTAFTQWLAVRQSTQAGDQGGDQEVRGIAIDGKSMRGARGYDGSAGGMPHVLGAATHDQAIVLGQVQVPGKTSEIASVPVLLDQLSGAGHLGENTVITLDALHTIRGTAAAIRATSAHYLMTVKANTPKLRQAINAHLSDCQRDPDVVVRCDDASGREHGRTEQRIVTAASLPETGKIGDVEFPGAAQVLRIVRYRGGLDGQRVSKEVVHAITSLPEGHAGAACLAKLIRGHWSIEVRHEALRYRMGVRDP